MDKAAFRSMMRDLVRNHIVTRPQLELALTDVQRGENMGNELLASLQNHGFVTPYQVEKIKRLDFDGLILGTNKILYPNSSGSFARVYRATDLETGEMIGLKVLRHRWVSDKETVELFHREAEIGKRLKHPNIVPIYDVQVQNEHHFFTMEFIEGGNLRDFVKIRKSLSPEEASRFILDMARGLEYALSLGFTHRDLKTTNVLMSSKGVAKLIDFGLAAEEETLHKIGAENLQTALEYSTLEKGTQAPKNDPRSDLFFLGGIFYELLCGHPPYERTRSREERKQLSRYTGVRPISQVAPECPMAITDIVERLMNINPNERHQSPTELIEDLLRVRQEMGIGEDTSQPANQTRQAAAPKKPVVFCVENRDKEAVLIREYLTNRGFQPVIFRSAERAASEIASTPPDCVLVMGDGLDRAAESSYLALSKTTVRKQVGLILVLGRWQAEMALNLPPVKYSEVMVQPFALRDLRQKIGQLLEETGRGLPTVAQQSGTA